MSLKERLNRTLDKSLRAVAVAGLIAGCSGQVQEQKPTPTASPTMPPVAIPVPETPTPIATNTPEGFIGDGVFTLAEATAIAQAQREVELESKRLEDAVLAQLGKKVSIVADIDAYTDSNGEVSTSIVYRGDDNGRGETVIYAWDSQQKVVEIKAGEGEDFKPGFDEEGNPWICLVSVPKEGTGKVVGYVLDGVLVRTQNPQQLEGFPIVLPVDFFVRPTPEAPTATPTPESLEAIRIPEIENYGVLLGFSKEKTQANAPLAALMFVHIPVPGDPYAVWYTLGEFDENGRPNGGAHTWLYKTNIAEIQNEQGKYYLQVRKDAPARIEIHIDEDGSLQAILTMTPREGGKRVDKEKYHFVLEKKGSKRNGIFSTVQTIEKTYGRGIDPYKPFYWNEEKLLKFFEMRKMKLP